VAVPEEECRKRERGVYKDAGLRPDTKIEFVTIPKGPDYLSYYTECLDSDYNNSKIATRLSKEDQYHAGFGSKRGKTVV
jgi:hypothetical protein